MPENNGVACDCPVEKTGEKDGYVIWEQFHHPSCPKVQAKELPPLGVCVSDTSGVAGKVGK